MIRFSLRSTLKRGLAVGLMGILFGAEAWVFAQAPGPGPAPPPASAAQALSPEQLDDLVAPIALYPDPLLSQVLVACTYPLEVVEAQQWLAHNNSLSGTQLMDAAKQQSWDPSVSALVAFPDVLGRLNSDIRWTTDLGNAFLSQQADVMAAVQRMRQRAQANGKLQSTPQQTVTTQMQGDQSAIQIEPANPDVIYVPYYDPAYIWGPPAWGYYPYLAYPAWGWGFWPGIDVGFCFGGWGGWGWGGWGWGWGPNWFGRTVFVNHAFFGRYGFHGDWGRGFGGRGFNGTSVWAHDPGHRLGVPYNNRNLTGRYGAASLASRANTLRSPGGRAFANGGLSSGRNSFGQSYGRNSVGQSYGRNSFGQPYGGNRAAGQSARSYGQYGAGGRSGLQGGQSFRGGANPQGTARSYQGFQGGTRSFGGANGARSYSAPSRSYGGGFGGAARSYAAPSRNYGGGFGGAARSYSAPSRSYGGGFGGAARSYSAPSRSFGGGGARSFGGGGGHSFGGGGGHSFGGGGGHSFGGGGGHGGGGHGGGRR